MFKKSKFVQNVTNFCFNFFFPPEIITKLKKFRSYKLYAVWLGHELNVFVNSPEYAEIYCKSSQLLQRSHKAKLIDFIAPKGLLFANGKFVISFHFLNVKTVV